MNVFTWLDQNQNTKRGKLLNQLIPVFICIVLYLFFIGSSYFFIGTLLNGSAIIKEKIQLNFHLMDVLIGFFLYFATAIDYALIIGRMQGTNPGAKARVIMNVATVVGCYVGVTLVLFLWGFAKDSIWLIIPILIFAGSVMIKLAYEGLEYFENSRIIPQLLKKFTVMLVDFLHFISRIFTFWMPEISKPKAQAMSGRELAKWSFLLPFIIGMDDLIGYMGAMTIYNVFGLLIGIYFADILIDIFIFTSPAFTKKIVESDLLAFAATFAFLFLAYKSYSESLHLLQEKFALSGASLLLEIALFILTVLIADYIMAKLQKRKSYLGKVLLHHRD